MRQLVKEKVKNKNVYLDLPLVNYRKQIDKPTPETECILFPNFTIVLSMI